MSEVPDKSSPDESQIMLYDAAFCIIAAEFNAHIVDALVAGAHSALLRHGVAESAIELVNVPGAFEVPLAAQRVARSGQYDGIVIAVCHREFVAMSGAQIREFGKPTHVLYDIKNVLPLDQVDGRL